MIEQKNTALFESSCKKMKLICDSDTPLGVLHDYLMALKGEIVERMQKAQKQEQEISEKMMKESEESNDS
jgi:hypothetical protein